MIEIIMLKIMILCYLYFYVDNYVKFKVFGFCKLFIYNWNYSYFKNVLFKREMYFILKFFVK